MPGDGAAGRGGGIVAEQASVCRELQTACVVDGTPVRRVGLQPIFPSDKMDLPRCRVDPAIVSRRDRPAPGGFRKSLLGLRAQTVPSGATAIPSQESAVSLSASPLRRIPRRGIFTGEILAR